MKSWTPIGGTRGRLSRCSIPRWGARRCRCHAIAPRKQLMWGETQDTSSFTSGSRVKRDERHEQEDTEQLEMPFLDYSDICNGVAWYKILVYGKKEEVVARQLEERIRELPLIEGSWRGSRYVSAWIPEKRVLVPTNRNEKGVRKMVKYGPLKGEVLFVACEMDALAYAAIDEHPYVQRFVHRHPMNGSLPLPCPSSELHDAFDWLWKDERVEGATDQQEILQMKPVETDEAARDIAFEVARLVNVRDETKGLVTIVDTDNKIPDECGPEWKEKQERLLRKQEAREQKNKSRRENRTEKRVTKGRWHGQNAAAEQQRLIEQEDYETTKWYEGQEETDISLDTEDVTEKYFEEVDVDVDSSMDQAEEEEEADVVNWSRIDSENAPPEVGREVLVVSGPYAEYTGTIHQIQDNRAEVEVDVFGKVTRTFFAFSEIRVME